MSDIVTHLAVAYYGTLVLLFISLKTKRSTDPAVASDARSDHAVQRPGG